MATISVLALSVLSSATGTAADTRTVNQPFKDQDGKTVKTSIYRGKVVLLNFWATWCVPCRAEMPMLVEAQREWSSRGVVFVAISLDDRQTRPKIPAFREEFKIGFPVWSGASAMDLDELKIGPALPATVFLDRDSRIAARVLGQIPKSELNERLEWLTGDRKGSMPDPLVKHVAEK